MKSVDNVINRVRQGKENGHKAGGVERKEEKVRRKKKKCKEKTRKTEQGKDVKKE